MCGYRLLDRALDVPALGTTSCFRHLSQQRGGIGVRLRKAGTGQDGQQKSWHEHRIPDCVFGRDLRPSMRGKAVSATALPVPNVSAVVPLLMVTNMERSLAFYVDGLGFTIRNRWVPDGRLRWCWMLLGGAALMLQEAGESTRENLLANGALGNGAAFYLQCADALAIYREAAARGIHPSREPQVGNFAWEVFFADPDGYKINFSSPTDLPDETLLSQIKA